MDIFEPQELLIFGAGFAFILIVSQLIHRFSNWPELIRKAVHISVGLWFYIGFALFMYSTSTLITWSLLFTLFTFLGPIKERLFKKASYIGRKSYGEHFFAVTLVILFSFFPNRGGIEVALLMLTFPDAVAALVGQSTRSMVVPAPFGATKTLLGTLSFFVFALVIMAINVETIAPSDWVVLVFYSILLTVVENISAKGSDNLTVPVLAYLLFALSFS